MLFVCQHSNTYIGVQGIAANNQAFPTRWWGMGIGDRIKLAREAAAISKSELARRIGVHPSACIQWESVDGTHPKLDHLSQVAVELGVRFEWLATGRGDMRHVAGVREEGPEYAAARLSADEQRLLASFRALGARKQKSLLELLDNFDTDKNAR